MSLKQSTPILAAIDTLERAVTAMKKEARAEVFEDLMELRRSAGLKSAQVTLPDSTVVGSVTLTDKKARGAFIHDEDALLEWVKVVAPQYVQTVPEVYIPEHQSVSAAFVAELLPYLEDGKNGDAIDGNGEVVPGVTFDGRVPDPDTFSIKFTATGRDQVVKAWREGKLADLLPSAAPALADGGAE